MIGGRRGVQYAKEEFWRENAFVDELNGRLTLVTNVVQYICPYPRLCAQYVRPNLQEKQIRSRVERFCKNWPETCCRLGFFERLNISVCI